MNFISENAFIIIIVLIVASAIIYNFFFTNKAVVKRKLKKAKVKRVHEFKSGQTAKITGIVECVDGPLTAPLSGRECAYYHVHVEQKVSAGKSSRWETLIDKEYYTNYVLRDGNACAYFEDEGLKSYIVQDREYSSGFMENATAVLEAYLQDNGHKSETYFGFNKTIRYREAVLEVGEEVAVFGQGIWQAAHTLELPDRYDNVLVMRATQKGHMYMSDDPETVSNNVSVQQ